MKIKQAVMIKTEKRGMARIYCSSLESEGINSENDPYDKDRHQLLPFNYSINYWSKPNDKYLSHKNLLMLLLREISKHC